MNDWIEIGTGPTWDFKEKKELTGIYVSKEEAVGLNNSNLYKIKISDGSVIGVWGNKILDDRFKGIGIGDEVKLEYFGLVKGKTGNEYHNFKTYHRTPETGKVSDENTEETPTPF